MTPLKPRKLYQISLAILPGLLALLAMLFFMSAPTALSAPLHQDSSLTVTKQGTSNWEARVKLVFTNTVAEDLTDFPVLVVLNSSRISYTLTQDAGQDIRFVDADGTLLPHEIERWDESGNSYIWVKIPQIPANSSDAFIWLYYNNPTAPDGQNPAAVWPSEYKGVWHFNDNTLDATTQNDGRSGSFTATPGGHIAGGLNFDGSGDFVDVDSDDSLDNIFASGGTIMAWINPRTFGPLGFGRILDKSNTVNAGNGWSLQLFEEASQVYNTVRFERDDSDPNNRAAWRAAPNSVVTNTWQFVALTYNDASPNSAPAIYFNGQPKSVSTDWFPSGSLLSDAEQHLFIGNFPDTPDPDRSFDGLMDEVRVLKTTRSANWVLAQYRSMIDNFIGYQTPEPVNEPSGGIVGAPFTYTLTVSNSGLTDASGVIVTDVLPDGANYVSGGQLISGGSAVRLTFGTVPANGTQTASFVVTTCRLALVNRDYQIDGSALPGPLQISLLMPPTLNASFLASLSQANLGQTVLFTDTSSSNGGPFTRHWDFGDGSTAQGSTAGHAFTAAGSYTVTLTLTDTCGYSATAQQNIAVVAPLLSVSKTAQPEIITVGERLTYTIVITNSGLGTATNVVLSDTLPSALTLVDGSVDINPPSAGGSIDPPPLKIDNLTVAPQSSVTVTFAVTVTGPLVGQSQLTNTVAITSDQTPTPVTATVTTPINPLPTADVAISVLDAPDPVPAGGPLTYTLQVTNAGPNSSGSLTVTATLPPTAIFDAAQGSSWQCNHLGGVVTCTRSGLLMSGVAPLLNITVTAPLAEQQLIFTATVDAATSDPLQANNVATATTMVRLPTIAFSSSSYVVDEGSGSAPITLTLNATPFATVTVVYTAAGGTATAGQDFVAGTGVLTLAPGMTQAAFSVPITDDLLVEPTETVLLSLGQPVGALLGTPAAATLQIIDDDFVDLSLAKQSSAAQVAPGERFTYTLVVNNSGNAPATGAVISDTMPGGVTLVPGSVRLTPTGAGSLGSPPTLVHNLTIAAGGRVTVTFAVTASAGLAHGDIITNTAAVTSAQSLLPATDSVTTTVIGTPGISLAKSGPAFGVVGQSLVFTFTATNSGSAPLQIQGISDDIVGAPQRIAGDANSNNRLDLTETWLYTAAYIVPPDAPALLINTARITATDNLNRQVAASAAHTTTIGHQPVLTLTKSGPAAANVGQLVTFIFTVSHDALSDRSPITDVNVVDDFAGPAVRQNIGSDDGDGWLEWGETWQFSASYVVAPTTPNPFTNVGLAAGLSASGGVVTATASHTMQLSGFDPELFIDQDGPTQAVVGDRVEFTYTVINVNLLSLAIFGFDELRTAAIGDGSPLSNVTVTDLVAGPATFVSGDFNQNGLLDAAEAWVFTAAHTITPVDSDPLVSVSTALARDPENDVISATDTVSVDILHQPAVQLQSTAPATATVGEAVDLTLTVSHSSISDNSALTVTGVSDNRLGVGALLSGSDTNGNSRLDSGEVWRYAFNYTVKSSDYPLLVHTSTLTGADLDGDVLSVTLPGNIEIERASAPGDQIYYLPLIFKN